MNINFDTISMTPRLINSSRIKYSILDNLFKNIVIPHDTINLYIDGWEIFRRLYKADFEVDVYRTNMDRFIKELVISFLNTIGHYRRYLITRLNKNNRIFVIWNRRKPKYQTSLVKDYGLEYYEKLQPTHFRYGVINILVEQAWNMAMEVSQYLEDIFIIDSKKLEDHVTAAFLNLQYPNGYNIYFSKNELFFELINDKSLLLYPSRDNSYLADKNTIINYFFRDIKYKPENISSEYMPYYFALSGIKSRNIKGTCVKGRVKGIKIIESMIKDQYLCNHPSTNQFIELIPRYLGRELTDVETDNIVSLYRAIIIRMNIAALTDAQIARVNKQLVNLYDQNGLEELNELADRETDVLDLTNLNMNRIQTRNSSWNWDEY